MSGGLATATAGTRPLTPPLRVGNLAVRREWGFAPEYVDGMVRVCRQIAGPLDGFGAAPEADVGSNYRDYVLGSGRRHAVWELIDRAFVMGGHPVEWDRSSSDPADWTARLVATGHPAVVVDQSFIRRADPASIGTDPSLARDELGWQPHSELDAFLDRHARTALAAAARPPQIATWTLIFARTPVGPRVKSRHEVRPRRVQPLPRRGFAHVRVAPEPARHHPGRVHGRTVGATPRLRAIRGAAIPSSIRRLDGPAGRARLRLRRYRPGDRQLDGATRGPRAHCSPRAPGAGRRPQCASALDDAGYRAFFATPDRRPLVLGQHIAERVGASTDAPGWISHVVFGAPPREPRNPDRPTTFVVSGTWSLPAATTTRCLMRSARSPARTCRS